MPRSEYRSDYSPPRRGQRVAEYETTDTRERRRGARERDFLREAYDRDDERSGSLMSRERIDERSERGGRRDREYLEEEVIIARSRDKERDRRRRRDYEEEHFRPRDRPRERIEDEEVIDIRRRERPVEYDEKWEELAYRPRRKRDHERDRERERISEEWVQVPRERPVVAREVEEWRFEPRRRRRDEEMESITIRERDRERNRPREEYRDEFIDIREQRRRNYHEDEIRVRERSRSQVQSEERIKTQEQERPTEEIRIIHRERDRSQDVHEDEIRITSRDRRNPDYSDEEIRTREQEHQTREAAREDLRSNGSTYSRRDGREDVKEEEIVIERNERNEAGVQSEEIVIRRKERSPSPAPAPTPPPPPPEPEIIRRPPIHQEIITHHRHIDHGKQYLDDINYTDRIGYEPYQAPVSAPPKLRTPSPPPPPPSPPRSTYDEIAIRHREENGRHEDDIVIKRKERDSSPPSAHTRGRSISLDERTVSHRGPPQIDDEADYYSRKTAERAHIGEAYHGATKDWAIVDVPPGTERVQMDGVGGASEEITWQRYNGVRRSHFIAESGRRTEREPVRDIGPERRRYFGARPRTDVMWTEITKDLVTKEAIESFGYEYEETEWFFYVMDYLRYEDVRRLVMVSDDIRSRRRERIKQIELESRMTRESPPPRMLAGRPWDEERERIVEREWIGRGSPRPSSPPVTRIIEKDKFVVIRTER